MEPIALAAATKLSEIVGRGTYDWVNSKRQIARNEKDIKAQKEMYEEIVVTLLEEKTDLQNVANQYQDLYSRVKISEDEIRYLKSTITRVIDLFVPDVDSIPEDTPNYEQVISEVKGQREKMQMVTEFIDIDTLETMQLLGFNYKEAIGKPLTEATANLIYSKTGVGK